MSAVEILKDSFVDADLQEYFSDLLYRVALKDGGAAFVYILFEHKSSPDKLVAFQLLRYMVRIWEPGVRESGDELAPIFPVVLYHGRESWRFDTHFGSLIRGPSAANFRKYLPDFEYHLCDLTRYKDEEIRGALVLRVALLAMKSVFSGEPKARVRHILALLADLVLSEKNAVEYLKTVLVYLSAATGALNIDEVTEAVREAFPARGESIMATIAETWVKEGIQKGIEQGIQQGIQQGKQTGAAEVTLRVLRRRFGAVGPRIEQRVTSRPVEQLEELGEALLDFTSLEDVERWLSEKDRSTAIQP